MTSLSMVVAVTRNGVIGRDGGLPWRLSTDLKRFKALTIGKPVVMGRVCYDSIGKPLPGRPNIVLSRNPDFQPDGVIVTRSIDEALDRAEDEASKIGADEIAIIGGGVLYDALLDRVDTLHVTHIEAEIEGDTWFPAIDPEKWEAVAEESVPAGERDDFATRFVTYRRRS